MTKKYWDMSFNQIIKKHYLAALCAVLFGALVILPTFRSLSGVPTQAGLTIYPTFNKDEIHYQAMTKEAAEGRFGLGNTYLYEHKDKPGLQAPLAEILIAAEAKLLRQSVPAVFAANDFFVSFINFILLYLLFYLLAGKRGIALFFAFLFFIFFLYSFGRAINPQFSFMFFTLGLIFIHKAFSAGLSKKTLFYGAAAGAVTGLLIYIYPYYWTALAVLYTLNLAARYWRERRLAAISPFLLFFPVLAGAAIPYAINHLSAVADPAYADTIARFGLLNNHWPACYTNAGMAILAGLVILSAKKYLSRDNFYYALIFIMSAVILNWQNVITGQYLQFSSHYYQVTFLFAFCGLALAAAGLYTRFKETPRRPGFRSVAALLAILGFLGLAGYQNKNEIIRGLNNKMDAAQVEELQSFAPVFNWLNNNTAPDSVVMADDNMLSAYLPVYTDNNLFSHGYSAYYLVSDDEMEERWVVQNTLFNEITADHVRAYSRAIWGNKFIDRYQNQAIRHRLLNKLPGVNLKTDKEVPDFYVERVMDRYREIKNNGIEENLDKYRWDYLVVKSGRIKAEEWTNAAGIEQPLTMAFSTGDWEIYEVNPVKSNSVTY